ncbi:hypothetical protein Tco_0748781 [Tanacetum coccineum]|uniref:Uncharacterized protein n=1 Tax=Tanacetum coccineum TaxID=301880 RepID=A0ABQ4YZE1_9ASTR
MKAAFEAFKKYEDDRVEQRCVKIDARLDKLSVDFDEELYPHMLTAIAARRWVIGHGRAKGMMRLEATLYLESDSGEDAPQWIRDLRPNYSQLKIPIYYEVHTPEDPWAIKEEMSLEDAIAANIISVPTVAPQGLAILLADAATQTGDEVSSRLLRSKSLPPMYNLDWP